MTSGMADAALVPMRAMASRAAIRTLGSASFRAATQCDSGLPPKAGSGWVVGAFSEAFVVGLSSVPAMNNPKQTINASVMASSESGGA
jgi:hypothetical protein